MLAMWAVRKSKAHRCVTDVVDQLVFEKQKIASARAAPVGIEALPVGLAGVADMVAVGALGDDNDDAREPPGRLPGRPLVSVSERERERTKRAMPSPQTTTLKPGVFNRCPPFPS